MADSKLKKAFVKALSVDEELVTDNLNYGSIIQWDSVAHMVLIAELEDVFDVMLETDDIVDMSSFAKAREILRKYDVDC